MTSSGVRDVDSTDKRTKKAILDREEDLINSYKTWDEASSLSSLAGGGTQSSGEGSAPGNFMPLGGANWLGQYGNQFEIITIQNGEINASRQSGASSPMLVLNPELGLDDFLDTILPGGDVLFYQEQLIQTVNKPITLRPRLEKNIVSISGDGATNIITVEVADTSQLTDGDKVNIIGTLNYDLNSAVITILNSTEFTYDLGSVGSATIETVGLVERGNIETIDGNDLVCVENTIVHFIFDTITQLYKIDSATIPTGSGGGGIQFPIDFPEDIRGLVGASTQAIDFTQSDRHAVIMEMSGDIGISLTNTTAGKLQITSIKLKQDGTGGHSFIGFSQTVANEQAIIDAVDEASGAGEFVIFIVRFMDGLFTAFLEDSNVIVGGGDPSQWSTFPAVSDVNMATFDITSIDRLRFTSNDGVVVSDDDPSIFLDGSSNMVYNIADQKQFFWSMNNRTRMQLDQAGTNNDTILTVETDFDDADAIPFFKIFRDDPTPAKDSEITSIEFIGRHAATDGGAAVGNASVYSKIVTEYESVITDREAASINFFTSFDNGATSELKSFLGLNNENSEEIEAFVDLNLVNNSLLDVDTLELRDDGTIGAILFNADGDRDTFISNNASDQDRIDVTVAGATGKIVFGFSTVKSLPSLGLTTGGSAFINVTSNFVAFDPLAEPADGIIVNGEGLVFFDTGSDPAILKIKKKDAAGVVSIVSLEGSGAQTPWVQNIDADDNDLDELGLLTFAEHNSFGSATTAWIEKETTNLTFNTPENDGYIFRVFLSQVMGLSASDMNLDVPLDMSLNKITTLGTPTTDTDAATKGYVDSVAGGGGLQDASLWSDGDTIEPDGESAGTFEFWLTNSKTGNEGTSIPIPAGLAYYVPIYIGSPQTIRAIGLDVTVSTGTNISVAIYRNRTDQNYPGTRVEVETSGFANGTGMRANTAFFSVLTPGTYWLAVSSTSGYSINQWAMDSAVNAGAFGEIGQAGGPIVGYEESSSTLPATAPIDLNFITSTTFVGFVPAVFARFYL